MSEKTEVHGNVKEESTPLQKLSEEEMKAR
jgi:hypothetical protein